MKIDHIIYMRFVYPLMSPYIANRKLTIIRCPDGVQEECFFQKHLPSYAPEFISSHDQKVTCDNLASMIWHANHSAIEFHVPFTNINSDYPDYIIFDLDPPTREAFPMAVKAAKMFKEIFDELELSTFIKTSGNKGLQIHLPLPFNTFSYEQTAAFTEKIAHIIVEAAPDLCTIERFKQNRKGRLYIDFVQHGRNKTIIAPYSPRKVSAGTVATPLYWDEVTESLTPDRFTLKTVPERIRKRGCPWMTHYEHARNQSLKKALPLFK